jgi:hypothetical protein
MDYAAQGLFNKQTKTKAIMFNLTPKEIKAAEKSIYSQAGQDGILNLIFSQIGEGGKYYVEFGARDGLDLSNTANFELNHGWRGLLMDAEAAARGVKREMITKDNINSLLDKYEVSEIDFISIDIDGNDYWVWKAMNRNPRVVLIEYNSKFSNNESYAIEYNPNHRWEADDYYGASLLALKKLGEEKGYTLVYVVQQLDAVFVRNDLISEDYIPPTLDELLPKPIIAFKKKSKKTWVEV